MTLTEGGSPGTDLTGACDRTAGPARIGVLPDIDQV